MFNRLKQLAPDLVTIPAGPFLMGSTLAQAETVTAQFSVALEWCLWEVPQHTVELPTFQISRGPVSCAEYYAFVQATTYPAPMYWKGAQPPAALSEHPVVGICLADALAYCEWLSTTTGRAFRLPSEAEWEKAARGDDGRLFPWGDTWDSTLCNTAEGGPGETTPVGYYPQGASPYGCVDMAGNIEEWTGSPYNAYPGSNLTLPDTDSIVLRGGCWNDGGELARCASRRGVLPDLCGPALGFRVVCGEPDSV